MPGDFTDSSLVAVVLPAKEQPDDFVYVEIKPKEQRMAILIIAGAVITIVIGLLAKYITDKTGSRYRIDRKELMISMAVMLVIVVPLTAYVGVKVAINNQVTYYENWNGWELKARLIRESCYEDGPMRHYWIETRRELVDVDVEETYTDPSTGEEKTRTVTKKEWKDVDYKIPYTTEEWTFVVETSIGDVQIAYRFLPENPNQYRYRFLKGVPSYPSTTGYPDFWLDVKDRVESNHPGPVTLRKAYENYILASQSSILKRFNDSIERYEKLGQLPAINSQVRNFYFSDRVYFVGVKPEKGSVSDWQRAMQRFDAALGQSLQGDLHLVVVDANKITDKDNYSGALFAYWQSPAFGKNALSKNGIVIVVGTRDGVTIDWAVASTGMPLGNEALLAEIKDALKGKALDPETLLGHPTASITGGTVKVTNTSGELEKLFWGPNRYKRVHMNSKDGEVGFEYLLRELRPTGFQLGAILFVITLFACLAWGICLAYGPETYRRIARNFRIRR